MFRAVIDTNVLFEGLTCLGPSAKVIDAWVERLFQPCVSTALVLEYQDVLARRLSPQRGETALLALQALLDRCEHVPIYLSYRPVSPDPGDDFLVDCVLNSRSILVTRNLRDFRSSAKRFGFPLVDPVEFLKLLEGRAPQ